MAAGFDASSRSLPGSSVAGLIFPGTYASASLGTEVGAGMGVARLVRLVFFGAATCFFLAASATLAARPQASARAPAASAIPFSAASPAQTGPETAPVTDAGPSLAVQTAQAPEAVAAAEREPTAGETVGGVIELESRPGPEPEGSATHSSVVVSLPPDLVPPAGASSEPPRPASIDALPDGERPRQQSPGATPRAATAPVQPATVVQAPPRPPTQRSVQAPATSSSATGLGAAQNAVAADTGLGSGREKAPFVPPTLPSSVATRPPAQKPAFVPPQP